MPMSMFCAVSSGWWKKHDCARQWRAGVLGVWRDRHVQGRPALPHSEEDLRQDPCSGAVFNFRGRRGDRIKVLFWDGQGVLPVLRDPAAPSLSLALAGGRNRAADIGSIGHAVGGHGLAPSRLVLATVSCGVMAV